jgi:ABC-type transport system involved in multi-copper enzyme maturation permease subunit
MAQVAEYVTFTAARYQFVAVQIVALILVAGALREEIRKGTLAGLFASGITSGQIVVGKVLGHLLPLATAVITAVPLLGLMRSWGGIPAEYVLAVSCITLTSAVAVASLALFLSLSGAAFHRVVVTGLIFLVAYAYATSWLLQLRSGPIAGFAGLFSPFRAMWAVHGATFGYAGSAFPWPLHCGAMLGLAVAVLTVASLLLRRAVGMQVARLGVLAGLMRLLRNRRTTSTTPGAGSEGLRPVTGSAVLWREGHGAARRWVWLNLGLCLLIAIAVIAIACVDRPVPGTLIWGSRLSPAIGRYFPSICSAFQSSLLVELTYTWAFVLSIHTASLAAASISQEREARSWPALLATPLTPIQIIGGKALAIVQRTLAGWLAFLTCLILIRWTQQWSMPAPYDPVPDVMLSVLYVPGKVLFLIGTGLYAGLRSRSSFSAVFLALTVILGYHFLCENAASVLSVLHMRSGGANARFAVLVMAEFAGAAVMGLLLFRSLRRHVF